MVNIISGIRQYPVKRLWQVVKTFIFQLALEQTTTITTAYEQFVMFSEAACHVSNSRKLSSPKTIRTWSLAILWLIKGRLLSLLQFYMGKVYGRRTRGLVYRSPLLTSLVQNTQAAKQNRRKRTLISTSLASTAGIADIISPPDFFPYPRLSPLHCRQIFNQNKKIRKEEWSVLEKRATTLYSFLRKMLFSQSAHP